MNGAFTGVLILLALFLMIGLAYVVARDRAHGREEGRPDSISDEVVTGLMSEMRKWQAEAAYWKAAAERLQRELDQR